MNILFFLTPKSEVDYIEEDASLKDTVRKMLERNYSEIPVVGKDGGYVGTIKSGDIMAYMANNRDLSLEAAAPTPLKNIRRIRDNKAVNINCQIEDMVEKVLNQNFVPVVDDEDKFIGIVTRSAVVRFMHNAYIEHNSDGTGDK